MSPLLLLASVAYATVNVDVCVKFVPDLDDADADYENDDYLTTNDPIAARGVHTKVFDVTGVPFLIANYWALDSGSYPGCLPVTLTLDPARSYMVQVLSEVDVNDVTVRVFDNHTTPAITVYNSAPFNPTAGTKTVYTPTSTLWNLTLVGSFAMHRSTLGTATPDELDAYAEACPNGGGGCCADDGDPADAYVYMSPTGARPYSKYVIAHVFGHCLLKHRTALGGGSNDSLVPTTCDAKDNETPLHSDGHFFVSEEYQSAAFWAGFAEYYSAAVFNDHTGTTACSMYFYKAADWDNDDGADGEGAQFLACYGGATVHYDGGFYSRSATDYFGTYCSGGLAPNRAMEFDWVRFLWAMDVDYDMSPEEIAEVYDAARADGDWFGTDAGWTPTYGAGAWELEDAATDLGYTDWGAVAATYGVAQ